ncbi:hypothetical protein D9M71_834380 [compost metagenome]
MCQQLDGLIAAQVIEYALEAGAFLLQVTVQGLCTQAQLAGNGLQARQVHPLLECISEQGANLAGTVLCAIGPTENTLSH